MTVSTLRPALILLVWIVLNGYGQEAPMVVSPRLPVGQIDLALPRKLPDFLRSAKLPEAVRLPTLSADEARVTKRGPLKSTGVRRFVSPSLTRRATVTSAGDGRTIQSVSITSPGAKQVRVHFRDFDAGAGEVWVFAPGDDFASPPFTGKGVFGDGEFWSGGVDSETVVIAYVTGSGGSSSREPPFVIDAIAHQWSRMSATGEGQASAGPNLDAASCNLDVSCYPSYVGYATAVARFVFVADTGEIGLCSGSLINTRSNSLKPYFLTAHHCISSNTEARSMAVQFLYQTSTCNGTPPNLASLPIVIGGTYLAGAAIPQGDYSFVQLTSAPAGVAFLGWNTTLDAGASVVGIHHPQGSFTRISFGTRGVDQDASVEGEIAPASLFYGVNWSIGLTEEGSSGSPLINSTGQILGTLTSIPIIPAGLTACQIPQSGTYGRFSNPYAAIGSYLNDTQPASLTVNPSSLAFQVTNGITPASQAVSVTTQSTSPISITLQSNQAWLHVSGGPSLSVSSPASLVVTVDPSTLATPGTVFGTVTISSPSTAPVTVSVSATVSTRPSSVSVAVVPNLVYQQNPDADGYSWFYTIRCSEQAGASTQLTGLKIGGQDYSSQVANFFGTTSLSAFGTVLSTVRARGISVPSTQTVEVDGVDTGSNRAWQATTQVQFLGPNGPPALLLSRSSLSFSYALTAPAPASQQVSITNSGGGDLQWSAAADSTWLTVSPANGTAPSTLTVGIRSAGLAPGSYSGTVTVSASGVADQRIAVSLVVTPAQLSAISISTSQVKFTYTVGGSSPAVQTVSITNSGGGTLNWSANSNSPWLVVSPQSGVAPSNLSLSVNLTGLAAGTYSDAVSVLGGGNTLVIFVGLTVSVKTGPTISVGGIVSGASYQALAAPGMLVSIFGTNLAPQTLSASSVPLSTSLAGVSVTFNGVKAPLYFVSPLQLNVQVPFEMVPGSANVTVTVNGQSDSQPVQIANVAPGIFTDGRRIVPFPSGNPGDILILYITGQGAVSPSVLTGAGPNADSSVDQLPRPLQPVALTIGGVSAPILFAGVPWGLVGVTQVNFQVPQVPPGDQPVVVTVGGQASRNATFTVLSSGNQ